ncbi:adenine methyltransferase [Aggregatibacter actinomycetemcomitans]|uniref:DNA N-6-adenine-methyltransferase n=2 Tax=Aggregatibacter actinomycetemcomitans TaxID=714 RepID=UPI00197C44B6|nr:DNA N-6-adenine-methyltransferase [Aggregatibacter actinomycetemcomitans]MBN6069430.1 adenine methyltransferase [Aggregatibacter actinomycetemcomitans]MBN6087093.1 adenine methyltransferase [Aggregatibacter actinomycetemcomitans]
MTDFDKKTWQTPQYVFNWLQSKFGWFDIDGCANAKNALCYRYIGEQGTNDDENLSIAPDFLAEDLFEKLLDQVAERCHAPLRIFVNPPYNNPLPFVRRAAELRKAGYFVVMLLPMDRSTAWFERIKMSANEVIDIVGCSDSKGRFNSGRIKFINPVTGEEVGGNNKGSMIVVFDPCADDFVQRTVSIGHVQDCGGYAK